MSKAMAQFVTEMDVKSIDVQRNEIRLAEYCYKKVLAEEGMLMLDQYQRLMGCDFDEVMSDVRDAALEFVFSSPKAFLSRIKTLKILGVKL